MAYIVQARNVNGAWQRGLELLWLQGVQRKSRAGDVRELPSPTITIYLKPQERVLFDPVRDANPFFHLFEAIWMLAGREDLAPMAAILKRMSDYSDNGQTLQGAYGHRWRRYYFIDQVEEVIKILKKDKQSRRAVIAMWGTGDLANQKSKDLPCNTHLYFKVRDDLLDMTVCNRSNDIIWGLYGANAVHMSVLMEYMAARLDLELGTMTTLSDSFHAYMDVLKKHVNRSPAYDYYAGTELDNFVAVGTPSLKDLNKFIQAIIDESTNSSRSRMYRGRVTSSPWLNDVAYPMLRSWATYQEGNRNYAYHVAREEIRADDWRKACTAWIERRINP